MKILPMYEHILVHTVCPFNGPFQSQPSAPEALSQGVLDKQLNSEDKAPEQSRYLSIFLDDKRGGKDTEHGFKVTVPITELKNGEAPFDVERIPDRRGVFRPDGSTTKPMNGYQFNSWLNAIDEKGQLKGWWNGHDRARYVAYEAGSASKS